MSKYSFNHIHLMSPDPTKTAEFYQQMFGASLVSTRNLSDGRIVAKLNLDGITFLITQTSDEKQFGLAHFGFGAENLNEAVNELKTKGVKFTKEPTQVNPNLKISFFQAPENVKVELQEGNA